jgi:hypothetical protein
MLRSCWYKSTNTDALCSLLGGATRAALTQHFALRDNYGDVNAKDGSQEVSKLRYFCTSKANKLSYKRQIEQVLVETFGSCVRACFKLSFFCTRQSK